MNKKLMILFASMLFFVLQATAQMQITGKVTGAEDGLSIPGVSILVKDNTNIGTTTNADGDYSITVPSNAEVLLYSFIGMKTQEVIINGRSVIDVIMEEDFLQLDEVIVTGYGVERRSEITGAITSIKAEKLQSLSMQSFDKAIQGQAAGVLVQSSYGVPGSAISIQIRGDGSINASSNPLFIVDGVQINTRDDLSAAYISTNPLSAINSGDIESIEILKDAASASIYGSQAANGVVLITTKRGKEGKTKFELNANTGWSSMIKKIDMMNTQEYINWKYTQYKYEEEYDYPPYTDWSEGYSRRWSLRGFEEEDWAPLGLSYTALGQVPQADYDNFVNSIPSYDWQDEIFQTGRTHNYELSASGGTEKTRFYVSGNYNSQEAQIESVTFERFGLKTNLDHDINDKLSFQSMINLSNIEQTGVETDWWSFSNPTFGSIAILPFNPPYDEDGEPYTERYRTGRLPASPMSNVKYDERIANTKQAIGNLALTYQITPDLKFKSFFGLDYRVQKSSRWMDPRTVDGMGTNGELRTENADNFNWITTQHFTYSKQIGENQKIDALAGFEYRSENQEYSRFGLTEFPNLNLNTIQSAGKVIDHQGFLTGWRMASYFANAKYAYAGKYFITGTIRRDGSSRFGKNVKWGTFPSAGISWLLSEEDFLMSVPWVSSIKLRASYGVTGNSDISNFASRALISSAGAGQYNKLPTLTISQLANTKLTWERQTTLNFGLDYSFLKTRISGSIEYYRKSSGDLLIQGDLPGTSGFKTIWDNAGSIINSGLEFSINTVNVLSRGFEWITSFNIAVLKNEIKNLPDKYETAYLQNGEAINLFYRHKYAGVNSANGLPMFYDRNGNITYNPKTGVFGTDGDDRAVIGDANSNFYGGFQNSFKYKGFTLEALLTFDYGKLLDDRQSELMAVAGEDRQYNFFAFTPDKVWLKPGDEKPFRRPQHSRISSLERNSDLYMVDMSYIRLKNVTLSYNLPSSLLNKIKLSKVNIYVQGVNLFTWTEYTGFDPESTVSSGESSLYSVGRFPNSKMYTVGIKLGF